MCFWLLRSKPTSRALCKSSWTFSNATALPVSALRPRLLCLHAAPELDSLRAVTGLKMWTQRADLFDLPMSSTVVALNPETIPLDGSTLRPHHFETLWAVFGFAGNPLPDGTHRGALVDLADARNALAHGEESPLDFGRRKPAGDVLRLVGRIEELVMHLQLAVEDYVRGSRFRS